MAWDGPAPPPGEAAKKRRRTSAEMEQLRARALLDDPLEGLTDAGREWVWRSLLKGVRVEEACVLALLDYEALGVALDAVRRRYAERLAAYKARRAAEGAVAAEPSASQGP